MSELFLRRRFPRTDAVARALAYTGHPAAFWHDDPRIFAGRDLKQGGTWLGLTRTGRLAAVTNYRDPTAPRRPEVKP